MAVQDTLAEFEKQRNVLAPKIEGDADYERLNINPTDSKPVIEGLLARNSRRDGLLKGAIDAINALLADGYPDLPAVVVTDAVRADLQNQIDTLTAAIADTTTAGSPASVKVSFGTPS